MDQVELLTIMDHFQIEGRGVVVVPDFAAPDGWKNCSQTVVVVTPGGTRYEATATFSLIHFYLSDRTRPLSDRWRITIAFSALTKDQVPIGSKILVSPLLKAAIQGPS